MSGGPPKLKKHIKLLPFLRVRNDFAMSVSNYYRATTGRQITRWYSVLISMQLIGFAIVSFWPSYLGVDGRFVTVPFRAVLLTLCLWCVILSVRRGIPRHLDSPTTLICCAFWIAYCSRSVWELVMHPWIGAQYTPETWEFALYLFLCTIPAFASTYLIGDIRVYRLALKWVLIFSVIGCVLSLQFHWVDLTTHSADARLQGNDMLSPILYGHLGVTAAILGIFSLVHKSKTSLKGLGAIAIPLGLVTVFLSASRGPLIALVTLAPLTLYFGCAGRIGRLGVWAAAFMAGVFFGVPLMIQQVSNRGIDLYTYFGTMEAFTASESSLSRMQLMSDAWSAFRNNPLLGAGLFETFLRTYPHNVLLEALMSTGVLGGTSIALLLGLGVVKSFQLMNRMPNMAWLPLLYLEYLIHLMVSGCIYFDPTAFALLGVVLAAVPMRSEPQWSRAGRFSFFSAPVTSQLVGQPARIATCDIS